MALTTRRKPNIHHRRARGAHHQHTKHYLKAYHPYLPLMMLLIVGLAINTLWMSRSQVLGASTDLTANDLLQTTNAERAERQLSDFRLNNKLSAAAQAKAIDMVKNNYWAHNAPSGKTPWAFVNQSGYAYKAAAENLAYGFTNPESTVTGWMNSPEHKTNIVNPMYRDVGFGITTAEDYLGKGPTTIIVAMYAEPASASEASDLASAYTSLENDSGGPLRTVARLQLLNGGQAPWTVAVITLLSVFGVIFVIFRHARAWGRVITSSESFVLHHKTLDVVIITFSIAGYILTRAAGYIG